MSELSSKLLAKQWKIGHDRLANRLKGLSDEEFFWEPVPGGWTVRRRETATSRLANGSGEWVIDYDDPEPKPPPFTTIAWRLVHIWHVNEMYYEHLFGAAKRGFDDWEIPHTAADAVQSWQASSERYGAIFSDLTDQRLIETRHLFWWRPTPLWRIILEVLMDNAHHGAEISCLRDLYRER
jgi:uncharacterized damage-inducible protein DinB